MESALMLVSMVIYTTIYIFILLFLMDIKFKSLSSIKKIFILLCPFLILYISSFGQIFTIIIGFSSFLLITFLTSNKPISYIKFFIIYILMVIIENSATFILLYFKVFKTYQLQYYSEFLLILLFDISLITISAIIIKKIFIKYDYLLNGNKFITYIIALLTGTIGVMFLTTVSLTVVKGQNYRLIKENLLFYAFIIGLLIVVFIFILLTLKKEIDIKHQQQQYKDIKSYVASLESVNLEMRKFKHDYINILTSMRSYIDDKDMDGLERYFYDNILLTKQKLEVEGQDIGKLGLIKVPSIKGLLTSKLIEAQDKNIDTKIEITEEIHSININLVSFNRILGVMFDNAIEAALETSRPTLRFALMNIGNDVLMVLVNNYDSAHPRKLNEIFKPGFSTKTGNRGLGLTTLKEEVDQLPQVDLNTRIEGDQFIHELLIRGGK